MKLKKRKNNKWQDVQGSQWNILFTNKTVGKIHAKLNSDKRKAVVTPSIKHVDDSRRIHDICQLHFNRFPLTRLFSLQTSLLLKNQMFSPFKPTDPIGVVSIHRFYSKSWFDVKTIVISDCCSKMSQMCLNNIGGCREFSTRHIIIFVYSVIYKFN